MSFIDNHKQFFEWLNRIFTISPIIFIMVSIILNIITAYKLDFLLKYGVRDKNECGNEYMEIESPNYQIYNALSEDSKSLSNNMKNAFILIQVAWIILITAITFKLLLDFIAIYISVPNFKENIKLKLGSLVIIGLIIASYISYLTVFSIYIDGIVKNLGVGEIGISNINTSNNFKKLLALYLPTLVLILPIIIKLFINIDINIDSVFIIFGVLYIFIIVIAIQYNYTSLELLSSINSTYSTSIGNIQSNIMAIVGTANTDKMPVIPPTTSSDKLKLDLIQNIKSIENVDGDNFILHDYKTKFWKYLTHQNGNELKDLQSDNTITSQLTIIRNEMRNIRNDTSVRSATESYTSTTLNFAIIILSIILYMLFHFVYKHLNKPVTASIGISIIILISLIVGPLYGWIMRVVSKTN